MCPMDTYKSGRAKNNAQYDALFNAVELRELLRDLPFATLRRERIGRDILLSTETKARDELAYFVGVEPIVIDDVHFSVVRFTETLCTPSCRLMNFSRIEEQASQCIPLILNVFSVMLSPKS